MESFWALPQVIHEFLEVNPSKSIKDTSQAIIDLYTLAPAILSARHHKKEELIEIIVLFDLWSSINHIE